MAGVVAGTTLAQLVAIQAATSVPVLAPRIAESLGVSASLVGYQVSLVYTAAMVFAAIAGGAIRRFGACRTLQVSMLATVLGALLATQASLGAIVVASVALGASLGGISPAAAHLLARFAPSRHRNLIFSIKQTGVPAGGMVAALIAPPIALAYGWRWAFVVAAVCALGIGWALRGARPRWDDDRDPAARGMRSSGGGLHLLWRDRPLRWLALHGFCLSFVQLSWTTFLVTMLVHEYGYGLVQAGLMLSITQGCGVASRIVFGWLADRTGKPGVVLLGMGVTTLSGVLIISALGMPASLVLMVLLAVMLGLSAVGWNGLYMAEVARFAPPGHAGPATGAAMTLTFGGILAGPAVFSAVFPLIGSYTSTYWMTTVVAAAGLVCLVLAYRAARSR